MISQAWHRVCCAAGAVLKRRVMANKDYDDSTPPEQRHAFGDEKVREGAEDPNDIADDSDEFDDGDDEDLDDEAEDEDEGSI
jgi:hypothetical protein